MVGAGNCMLAAVYAHVCGVCMCVCVCVCVSVYSVCVCVCVCIVWRRKQQSQYKHVFKAMLIHAFDLAANARNTYVQIIMGDFS